MWLEFGICRRRLLVLPASVGHSGLAMERPGLAQLKLTFLGRAFPFPGVVVRGKPFPGPTAGTVLFLEPLMEASLILGPAAGMFLPLVLAAETLPFPEPVVGMSRFPVLVPAVGSSPFPEPAVGMFPFPMLAVEMFPFLGLAVETSLEPS